MDGGDKDFGLRQVVPVAQRLADSIWLCSVEIWNHGLVVRSATTEDLPRPYRAFFDEVGGWVLTDDAGTTYTNMGGHGGGSPQVGLHYDAELAPTPPPEATSLHIRRETGEVLVSVHLAD